MENKSFLTNYVKIYFWQASALFLRLISLFAVTPSLSKVPSIYGIYSVCVSVTIFFSYADVGFLRASQKFASESYALGDKDSEIKFIGFGAFIALGFTLFFSAFFFVLSLFPSELISGLDSSQKENIASNLLLILALFSPIAVLQRIINIFFDVRLESYVTQRLSLVTSLVSILSTFYFFGDGNYDIVSYFFLNQILGLLVFIISILIIKKRYNYNFRIMARSINFNNSLYERTKQIAYSGLYVMVMWLIFYELDQIVIAKFLGVNRVAIYGIAYSILSLFRSIFGILFTPIMNRSNHFVGLNDEFGYKDYIIRILTFSSPIVILPTIAFAIIAKSFILTWVGDQYIESISLSRYFSLSFSLSFFSYVLSVILLSKEKIKEMYIISSIQPLFYWLGIFFSVSVLELDSFGFFKFFAIITAEIYSIFLLVKFLNTSVRQLFEIFKPLRYSLVFVIISVALLDYYLPHQKSLFNLLLVIISTSFCVFIGLIIHFFNNRDFLSLLKKIDFNIFNKTFSDPINVK